MLEGFLVGAQAARGGAAKGLWEGEGKFEDHGADFDGEGGEE